MIDKHNCAERLEINPSMFEDYPPVPEKQADGRWTMSDNEGFEWSVKFCPYCGDRLA